MTDIAYQVMRATGTGLSQFEALSYQDDDMAVLKPGLDYHAGHLYMTFPIDRHVPKTIGKGKNQRQTTERITETMAIRSAGPGHPTPDVIPYDEEHIRLEGFRFPSTFTQATVNRWPMESMKRFLGEDATMVDPEHLFTEIKQVYRDHVEYPDAIYYDVVPLFVMTSYLFRLFSSTGYIHFNGTAASGKSQNLRVLSALALNTVWASNMSTASMFRQVAGCPGVICVDEAEDFKSEQGQALRQLLLAGYAEGSVATRAEKGPSDRFETVPYDLYSPKVIASINPLDPVLSSRCLVIPMQRALRTVPDFDAAAPTWAQIRGRLYTWAFQHHAEVRRIRDDWRAQRAERAPELRSRHWEVAQSYVTLAEHVRGDAFADYIAMFLVDSFTKATKARESSDRQLTLLKSLPRLLQATLAHPDHYYALKDIHQVAISFIDEDAREYYKTRTVGRHMESLGFRANKTAKGGAQFQIEEADVRRAMERHGIEPFLEDQRWYAGTETYQPERAAKPPEPEQQGFDFLDGYTNG